MKYSGKKWAVYDSVPTVDIQELQTKNGFHDEFKFFERYFFEIFKLFNHML